MTPTELHEEMIKAAMEAYDRAVRSVYETCDVRDALEDTLRERLSQVAQAVALEMVPVAVAEDRAAEAYTRGVEAGREAGYREGSDS